MARDLTSVDRLEASIPGGSAIDDSTKKFLIASASRAIEGYCGRRLASQAIVEDFKACSPFYLRETPISFISRLAYGSEDALSVQNTAAATTRATVRNTEKSLILTSVTSGVETNTELLYSSYATITLLAAQIDATSGWDATVLGSYGGYPSADLVQLQGPIQALEHAAYLRIYDESVDVETLDKETGLLTLQTGTSYRLLVGFDDIPPSRDFYAPWLRCWYQAGYDPVPEDLQQACAELAAFFYGKTQRDPDITSEKLGDYSYTLGGFSRQASDGWPVSVMRNLSHYRRIRA